MIERCAAALAGVSVSVLAACSSPEAAPPPPTPPASTMPTPSASRNAPGLPNWNMPPLKEVLVECVDVTDVPTFTDAGCEAMAANVRAGVQLLSDKTGNAFPPPKVSAHRLPEAIQIADFVAKRCVSTVGDQAALRELNKASLSLVGAVLKRGVDVDFSNTALYIGVNAPETLCPPVPPPPAPRIPDESCPTEEALRNEPRYPGARSMVETGKPIILDYSHSWSGRVPGETPAHELVHLGRGFVRVGHERVLCSSSSSQIPSIISMDAKDLRLDFTAPRGSLMSYGRPNDADSIYIAPPQLAYLDVISEKRVIHPTESGTFTLDEPLGQGPAAIEVPLSNHAIQNAISFETLHSRLKLTDYKIWVAKLPNRSEVGIYAAPALSTKDRHKDVPDIFLIDTLVPNKSLTIENDAKITVSSASADAVTVDLQLY